MTHQLHKNDIVDPSCQQLSTVDLGNAPVSTILGISDKDAVSLKASLGIKTIADLANHPVVMKAQAAVAAAATASTPAQTAFYKLLNKNVQTSLGASIQGTFRAANYPTGFSVCTLGATGPANYNLASLQALDALLAPDNDTLLQFQPQAFSNYYYQIMLQGLWKLSTADQATINSPDVAQAQQLVWAATVQDQIPVTVSQGWGVLITWVCATFAPGQPLDNTTLAKAAIGMNLLYPNASLALTSYVNTMGPASAIQCAQSSGMLELIATQLNTKIPTASNGGLQTAADTYYVGYTVPIWATLTSGLNNLENKVSIGCEANSFTSATTNLTINNSSFSVSPGWFSVTAKGSSSATNIETYTTAKSTMILNIDYQGITSFGTKVSSIATNLATGWYDNNILTQMIKTWNTTAFTGFGLGESTTFAPPQTFGPGKPFGQLNTWVISQPPTVSFTITDANVTAMAAAFQQGSSYTSIGIFSVSSGSQSSGYTVSNYQASGTTVTVTISATNVALLPPTQQTAFVLGGVASYPPNNT